MEEIESYDLSLSIKQLKLAVKFPCRLTLQHAGTPISPQIQSNGTNIFAINKQVNIKEDKQKDYLEININLATDKGGNIMAGIIKINLKDISNSEGENLTVSLQKCLDPYATCLINVKSVRINRSRVKKGLMGQDRKKSGMDHSRFETKSDIMIMDGARNFKPKPRYNDAESFVQKRVNLNTMQSPVINIKQKALSMAGFRGLNSSFEREEMGSRFKHLSRKEEQDNKTVITGKWKDPQQTIKASMEATQKSLKLQIIKFKTKHEQSERNLEQKSKQIKNLKDQISELNRQLTEKQYLIDQNNSKSNQIAKLEQANKQLSRQINDERNRIIDLQRQIEEQKNSNFLQISRFKEDNDKKEHQFQKHMYEKKEELKQITEQNQYKINQINKMKSLIEDLQRNLDLKTYQFEKNYNNQRNQHNKAKAVHQQKTYELTSQIKRLQTVNSQTSFSLKKAQQEIFKLQKKINYLQSSLAQNEKHLEEELKIKQKVIQDNKRLQKIQQQLNLRLKNLQKDYGGKQKELEQTTNQFNQLSGSSKKRLAELLEKNKAYTSKIQQLQNKVNLLTAQEEKLKRSLDMLQKQSKTLQQNEKVMTKNLKLKDDRILQLQKQMTDIQNKHSMKDNMTKKEIEYKGIQLQKLTVRATELQKSYQRQKQSGQQKRLQMLKSENRIKMLQENNGRFSEQIKQLKALQIKKDEEWNEKVRELKDDIKALQARQAQCNKQLHNNDIQKINFKNQISKLQKLIQSHHQKFDRLKKRQAELQTITKTLQGEIQHKNEEIVEIQSSYKVLENQYKFLQADKSKTEKISNIITEEKDLAKNDINKLKKELQKRQQKEEHYLNQIKNFKEEITKWQIKLNSSTKDYEKFKGTITQAIKSCYSIKNSYASLDSLSPSLDLSKSINRSRVKHSNDYPINLDSGDTKHGEAIQMFAKESHQTVMMLNDELKKSKRQRENLEKELNALNIRFKETEDERVRQLKDLQGQIETVNTQYSSEIEQYQEKISSLQRELKNRQRSILNLEDQLNELKQIQHNTEVTNQMNVSELLGKINSLKNKIIDWQRKDQNNSHMFVNLQQKIVELEGENTQLTHQNQVLSQQLSKKQRLCQKNIQLNEDLTHQLESTKKIKSDLSIQLLTLKESLTVEKQSNRQLLGEIRQEGQKNTQLRAFNNELLKEKEALIKKQAQKTEKIYGLQQKIQIYMIEIAEKNEQISKRDKINTEYRQSIKISQNEGTNYQISITDLKLGLERERQKVKEKERKIVQKQSQIQNLNSHIKKITAKTEARISNLTQQNEALTEELHKQKDQNNAKRADFESQIKKLKETQKKLNDSNQSLQELIFFEKQTNSLTQAKVQELKQQIVDLSIQADHHRNEIHNLNEQLRQKDESLFALSGKLYSSDNRLESKEDEFKGRMQKVELEWRYKIEQICEQYENKLQLMERQRSYVKTGVQSINETIQKLQLEKAGLLFQMERQRQNWQLKLKKAQEQKLASLIDKNKQIQRLREVFEELEEKMKRKDFQYKALQDDKRKIQQKLKELRAEVQKSEDKKGQAIRNMEKEMDQLKRKEGQLKRFKEALKNNQWAIERQIKKNIQICSKGIVGLASQQAKDDVMNMMRNLQLSITKLALPNIDEL